MAITKVGASDATNSGAATSLNRSRTATVIGNVIVIASTCGVRTNAATISDTQGNVWADCNPDQDDATLGVRVHSWYCHAKNTTATTITVASNNSSGFMSMVLDEFTGTHLTAALDQHAEAPVGSTGADPVSPAITLGADNCVVWCRIGANANPAPALIDGTTGTQGADTGSNDETEYRVLTGRRGASVTAAWTMLSAGYTLFVASFKPPLLNPTGPFPTSRPDLP